MEYQSVGGEIELTALEHYSIAQSKKDPNEVIIMIPVKLNNLSFHMKKGADGVLTEDRSRIKLPFVCWANDEDHQKYSSHSIKQNWPKEHADKVKTENEGKEKSSKVYAPSLGFANVIEKGVSRSIAPSAAAQTIAQGCEEDLPF